MGEEIGGILTTRGKTMNYQLNIDCEGPISINDNAFELCEHFIPDGNKFFNQLSKYDDFLASVIKRPNYKAGDTLRLILPFLKAVGVTNHKIDEFCSKNISLMPKASPTLRIINRFMPIFIISTSYSSYINTLCKSIGFDKKNTFCTRLDLDKYNILSSENQRILALIPEIVNLPTIEVISITEKLDTLSEDSKKTVKRLDEIFWEEIIYMEAGKLLNEVNPIGGPEKVRAVMASLDRTGNSLNRVMYVGDSITDVEALRLVREHGGLSISFNGNGYALESAEVACISYHSGIIAILAEIFSKKGRVGVLELVQNWQSQKIETMDISPEIKTLLKDPPTDKGFSIVARTTNMNIPSLIEISMRYRKRIRGQNIGGLG